MGDAAEYPLAESRMSVAAGNDQVDAIVLHEMKQGVRHRHVAGPYALIGTLDVVTQQKLHDIIEAIPAACLLARLAKLGDGHGFGRPQERQRLHDGPARLAAVLPRDRNPLARTRRDAPP